MELGISPIITSNFIIQLLIEVCQISVNFEKKKDLDFYNKFQKLISFTVTLFEAIFFVYSGIYGNLQELGMFNFIILILQLFISSIIIIMLDETLCLGYGFGNGISLFIAIKFCENIAWQSFSPTTINIGTGQQFEGIIIATFHLLFTHADKLKAINEAFNRKKLPNLTNLFATIFTIFIGIFIQKLCINLPLKNNNFRGSQETKLPLKLFCNNVFPIIFQSMLVSNLSFFSQILSRRYKNNLFVKLFGIWKISHEGKFIPISGLSYYIFPPENINEFFFKPKRIFIYVLFNFISSTFFSIIWVNFSNDSPEKITFQIRKEKFIIRGFKEKYVLNILRRYIKYTKILGGFCIGTLSIFFFHGNIR